MSSQAQLPPYAHPMPSATPKSVGRFSVQDKIAVVTGGGSGIGFRFTQLLVASGARVVIGDVRLTDEASSFVSNNPKSTHFEHTDVTSFPALENLFYASLKQFDDVPDIYVPSAGIFDPPGKGFWDDGEQDGFLQMRINAEHPIKLTRLAIRALVGRDKPGVVMMLASSAGLTAHYTNPLYCATKHAIVGFTRALGTLDTSNGVKVVAICPGFVSTPLLTKEKREQFGLSEGVDILTTEQVAEIMLSMVEGAQYPGGSVVETFASEGPQIRAIPDPYIAPEKRSSYRKMIEENPEKLVGIRAPAINSLAQDQRIKWP